MEDCIFCKIVAKKIPSYSVYEDNHFYGFLDIRPLNPGHSLLIPKKHYRFVYDVPEFGLYWEAAQKLAQAIQRVTSASSINFLTVGEEVHHAHIWIIPRFENDGGVIDLKNFKKISPEEMKRTAQQIFQPTSNH